MKLENLSAHADRNGLLVRRTLVPAMWSRAAWRHAHAMGYLVSVQPGVSRLADAIVTPHLAIAAAVEAARRRVGQERVFAGGRTAAFLAGVDVPWDDPIHVVTRGRPPRSSLAGVAIHRPTHNLDLVAADATETSR
jgi:hypothetical protein